MKKRVVITGMGIVAPNAHGLEAYEKALRKGQSGIRFIPELRDLNFSCQIGGVPQDFEAILKAYFDHEKLLSINENIGYASVSAIDAWTDAGLPAPEDNLVDWDAGVIIGSGIAGMDVIAGQLVPMVNKGQARRMGSRIVEQTMGSASSALIAGILALGNQVTSNSSGCTGNEAVIKGMWRIRMGLAKRMLAGGSEGSSPYTWSGFDAARALCCNFNNKPEEGSRPMSASACGFVPGSGGAVLVLEELETALERGARIYAEIIGSAINSGGRYKRGRNVELNPEGVRRCIRMAMDDAGIKPGEIDAINGHLASNFTDPIEVRIWSEALDLAPLDFPYIQSTKSLVGHCLGAAGAVECVTVALQLYKGFIHPSANCKDTHPEIANFSRKIPQSCLEIPGLRTMAAAGISFGDTNSCIIFRKWEE